VVQSEEPVQSDSRLPQQLGFLCYLLQLPPQSARQVTHHFPPGSWAFTFSISIRSSALLAIPTYVSKIVQIVSSFRRAGVSDDLSKSPSPAAASASWLIHQRKQEHPDCIPVPSGTPGVMKGTLRRLD
jgi:hypothetical protein